MSLNSQKKYLNTLTNMYAFFIYRIFRVTFWKQQKTKKKITFKLIWICKHGINKFFPQSFYIYFIFDFIEPLHKWVFYFNSKEYFGFLWWDFRFHQEEIQIDQHTVFKWENSFQWKQLYPSIVKKWFQWIHWFQFFGIFSQGN